MANKLRDYRKALGMSMSELGRRSGISRMTIWKIENDAPQSYTMRTLQKLASALGASVDEIFNINAGR